MRPIKIHKLWNKARDKKKKKKNAAQKGEVVYMDVHVCMCVNLSSVYEERGEACKGSESDKRLVIP